MGYVRIQYETMKTFSNAVFQKMGFTPDEAAIITDVLLTSDMYGIESHGVQRMVLYYKTIKNGRIHMDSKWEIIHETPISAVIDNHFGVGQLVGHFAMNKAIEKMDAEIAVLKTRMTSVDNKLRVMTQGKTHSGGSRLQKAPGSKIPVPSKKPK